MERGWGGGKRKILSEPPPNPLGEGDLGHKIPLGEGDERVRKEIIGLR
jgi:hypothetical protein